jgi:hypothetical protein
MVVGDSRKTVRRRRVFQRCNPYFNYDIAKDGRFLMIKPVAGSSPEGSTAANVMVVEHWFEELKRLTAH